MRVLRIYHSAVVTEYRRRDRFLRERFGHEVVTVCPPDWEEGGAVVRAVGTAEDPVAVIDIHGRREPNLFWYRRTQLRAILKAVRPHVVDLHEEPFSLAAGAMLDLLARHAPEAALCVYTAQNLPKRYPPPFSTIESIVLRRAAAAYPCSTEAGERLRARGFRGELTVMPLGIPDVTRHPRPWFGDRPTVGFVGRLEPHKGPGLAVQAFADTLRGSNARLVIVGDGSLRRALHQQVSALGIEPQVDFLGFLSQEATLEQFGRLDILMVPSLSTRAWKEQFGRVAAQAMGSGAVVVASDSGSLREVVGDAGILAQEGDVGALSAALRRLTAERNEWERLQRLGVERAARTFTWEAVAAQMDAMYRRAVERSQD